MMSRKDREDEQFWMNSAIELASLVSDMEDREPEDFLEDMFKKGTKSLLEMAEAKILMYSEMRKDEGNKVLNAVLDMQVTLKKWIEG
tara:strand:+ start:1590 stop:1850 length:261 start_codon:yes stop_codon:yes gene_type:complete